MVTNEDVLRAKDDALRAKENAEDVRREAIRGHRQVADDENDKAEELE